MALSTIAPFPSTLSAQSCPRRLRGNGLAGDFIIEARPVRAGTSAAVRVAHYLDPNAYLLSASAVLLGPAPDGRLFISGRRNQRTRLRTLEIIQNEAPPNPSTASAVIGDDLGEWRVDVSSPRQRFLEAFRLTSEHASAIAAEMRNQMAARLVEENGSPQGAADAVWALARENGWYREGENEQGSRRCRSSNGCASNWAAPLASTCRRRR